MNKTNRISEETYNLLEKARLPSEEIKDTLRRLLKMEEQKEFIRC